MKVRLHLTQETRRLTSDEIQKKLLDMFQAEVKLSFDYLGSIVKRPGQQRALKNLF